MNSACSLSARYGAKALGESSSERVAKTLYVVGGLYGNLEALDTVERRVKSEGGGGATVVFNGDFNFFNASRGWYEELNARIRELTDNACTSTFAYATRGNIETEVGNFEKGRFGGCGCGYPSYVTDDVVQRSDEIVERLAVTACNDDADKSHLAWMRNLPMFMTLRVGDKARVGVVHGDPNSLVGWGLAAESMPPFDRRLRKTLSGDDDCTSFPTTTPDTLRGWFRDARCDIFASTHTCLPAARRVAGVAGGAVFNSGSAGMPNFRSMAGAGLMTRISCDPAKPYDACYSVVLGNIGVRIDAVPIPYDDQRWRRRFLSVWPENSPAYISYFHRIRNGPHNFLLPHAMPRILSTKEG